MIVNETVIVEIVKPGTGDPVPDGEVGEVVVTSFNPDYPMIRLAHRRSLRGAARPARPAAAPTCASRAGWAAPTRPPRSRACSCTPGRSPRWRCAIPELKRLRLVVTRADEQDAMTLVAECAGARCRARSRRRRQLASRHQAQRRREAGRARQPAQRRQGDRRRAPGGVTRSVTLRWPRGTRGPRRATAPESRRESWGPFILRGSPAFAGVALRMTGRRLCPGRGASPQGCAAEPGPRLLLSETELRRSSPRKRGIQLSGNRTVSCATGLF